MWLCSSNNCTSLKFEYILLLSWANSIYSTYKILFFQMLIWSWESISHIKANTKISRVSLRQVLDIVIFSISKRTPVRMFRTNLYYSVNIGDSSHGSVAKPMGQIHRKKCQWTVSVCSFVWCVPLSLFLCQLSSESLSMNFKCWLLIFFFCKKGFMSSIRASAVTMMQLHRLWKTSKNRLEKYRL